MTFDSFLASLRTWDPGHSEARAMPVDWPFVNALSADMQAHDRLVVVKSRQMLVTWLGCAWVLYRALTGGPGTHLVISKEGRSAKEMIMRIAFLLDHRERDAVDLLDPDERVKMVGTAITFTDRDVRILSLPASPHAVRGQSPTTVFWDEMAFTPRDQDVWSAVKPAVDAGGRFLGVSTPNGPTGVFHDLVRDESGRFHVHRLRYQAHPERTKGWETSARAGLSGARWRREQELSFEGAEGKVYDQFEQPVHVLPHRVHPARRKRIAIYRGLDFGYRRPAVVWAFEDERNALTVFADLLGDRWSLDRVIEWIRMVDEAHGITERDVTWTAVDPAGAAASDFGISPVEALREAGFKVVYRSSNVSPGIETVRALLRDANDRVLLRIDPRCEELIRAFEGYAWDGDDDAPKKDGLHDHLMDALRYLVINLPRFQRSNPPHPARVGGAPG